MKRYRAQKGSLAKGSWHGAAVTEGASGRCSSGFIMGRYLLVVINNPTSTAVTIPGFGGAVTTCMSYRGKLIPETLRALASGALLSCSGKKVSKEAGLRGKQLTPVRCFPLKDPP